MKWKGSGMALCSFAVFRPVTLTICYLFASQTRRQEDNAPKVKKIRNGADMK